MTRTEKGEKEGDQERRRVFKLKGEDSRWGGDDGGPSTFDRANLSARLRIDTIGTPPRHSNNY